MHKKILIYILILWVWTMVTGCNQKEPVLEVPLSSNPTENVRVTVEEKEANNVLTKEVGEHQEIIDSWQKQYEDYIKKIDEGQATLYDYIMASDRANGLRAWSKDRKIDEILSLKENELKQYLENSPILNGYTEDGVHFVAIVQPVTISASDAFEDAILTVRENQEEMEIFETLNSFSYRSEYEYFAVDIFVEDLWGDTQQHDLNVYLINQEQRHSPLEEPQYEGELDYLTIKYNREMPFNKKISDRSWQLFLFDTSMHQPRVIVEYAGEQVELTH